MTKHKNSKCSNIEVSEEDKAVELVKLLLKMKARPGMYFYEENRYGQLMSFINGLGVGINLYEKKQYFTATDLDSEAWERLDRLYNLRDAYKDSRWYTELTDDERFSKYIDIMFEVFAEHYSEKAKELGVKTDCN